MTPCVGTGKAASAARTKARSIGGTFLVTAIAAVVFAQSVQAQTANQWRYQFDQSYHIVYYSPEAFECRGPGNESRVSAAIVKTQAEMDELGAALASYAPEGNSTSPYGPQIDALNGIIAHLGDILSRLRRLPPCAQPSSDGLTNGLPAAPDDTSENGNGPPDDSVNPNPDGSGEGGPGNSGENSQGASGCVPGSNGSDQGGCAMQQNGMNGMNGSNGHNDGGNGKHNNH